MIEDRSDATKQASADTSRETSQNLNQAAFADPKSFLEILKKDFGQIASSKDGMSRNDLIVYSQSGADQEGRAAAKIALAHFDELTQLDKMHNLLWNHGSQGSKLSADDLSTDEDLFENRTTPYTLRAVGLGTALTAVEGACTIGMGAMAAAAFSQGWSAFGSLIGIATLTGAGHTLISGYTTVTFPGDISALAKKDQEVLASWSEINGGTSQRN